MTPTDAPPGALRRTPLHAAHHAAGARFTDFAGWELPVSYGGELAEHRAVREAAGLFDLSHMAEFLVRGPDAADYLDRALAGRPSAIAPGRAKYSLLLTQGGGVIDDLVVYRTGDDRFLVVANAANREPVGEALRERSAGRSVTIIDQTEQFALLAVQGPAALAVLRALPDVDEATAASLADLRYYASLDTRIAGHPVMVSRTGYTGEDGFELYTAVAAATPLWNALLAAGEPQGLVPAGLAARDSLRLEAGMPLYGHELTRDTLPQQAGLHRVVALEAGHDFVGRAAVEAGAAPAAPVLAGLLGVGRRAAREGYPVFAGDLRAGAVTSGVLSPTLDVPIALAYLSPQHAVAGTELSIDIRGTRHPFTVTPTPFYRRKKTP